MDAKGALQGTDLEGLNDTALHIIRRLLRGQKFEARFSEFDMLGRAFIEVEGRSLVERDPTSKGRKCYVMLTGKGRAALDALRAHDRQVAENNRRAPTEREKRERMESVAPRMYALLRKLVANPDGYAAASEAAEILREIEGASNETESPEWRMGQAGLRS